MKSIEAEALGILENEHRKARVLEAVDLLRQIDQFYTDIENLEARLKALEDGDNPTFPKQSIDS